MQIQVTFDANDPQALGRFWAEVLGYREEPPPDGFADWDAALDAWGIPPEDRDKAYAIGDPEGKGPRIFLQKVPETKSAKSRVHLDVNVTNASMTPEERKSAIAAATKRAVGLGAIEVRTFDEQIGYWTVMQDPEGNDFCFQ